MQVKDTVNFFKDKQDLNTKPAEWDWGDKKPLLTTSNELLHQIIEIVEGYPKLLNII